MIRLVRWRSLLLGIAIILAGTVPVVQSQSGIPPIPRKERFTNRSDLSATLKVEPTVLAPGQVPELRLVLENKSSRALRLSHEVSAISNVRLSFHDASDEQIEPTQACIIDRWIVPTAVQDLMVLKPAESRVFNLGGACGGLPRMPAGKYRIRATYTNAPDWPSMFDIYAKDGDRAWDGRVETPSVDVTVLPLDHDIERQLIAAVEGTGPDGVSAIYRLGLGRSAVAATAIVRRLERERSILHDAVVALADIGDATAIAALGNTIERTRELEIPVLILRSSLAPRTSMALVPLDDGCAAIPLRLLGIVGHNADTLLEKRCPDLRKRLRTIRDTAATAPQNSDEYRIQTRRAFGAREVLSQLERVESVPAVVQYDDEQEESPDPRRLDNYVRELSRGDSWQGVALRGLVRFGTKDTYLQLRAALDDAKEDMRPTISALIEVVTFHEPERWQDAQSSRYWDSWWTTNRSLSRAAWAEETLARWRLGVPGQFVRDNRGAAQAADYLLWVHNNSPQVVSRLSQHRSWFVRLAVADTVAAYDRKRAGRLLIREFSGRYLLACRAADEALRELTHRHHWTDCTNPAERQTGMTYWNKAVDELR